MDTLRKGDADSAAARAVALAGVIGEIEAILARLDALGLTAAAAHVSLGLDLVRAKENIVAS